MLPVARDQQLLAVVLIYALADACVSACRINNQEDWLASVGLRKPIEKAEAALADSSSR